MKAKVTLEDGMVFTGKAGDDFTVRMDSSPAIGGTNSGFRPTQLVLVGLGGCTAMDVISILRKKRQDVADFEVHLDARQNEEHPHIFTHIHIKYVLRGRGIRPEAVERSIELSSSKYCSVQAMLAKSAEIEHSYEIIEEE